MNNVESLFAEFLDEIQLIADKSRDGYAINGDFLTANRDDWFFSRRGQGNKICRPAKPWSIVLQSWINDAEPDEAYEIVRRKIGMMNSTAWQPREPKSALEFLAEVAE